MSALHARAAANLAIMPAMFLQLAQLAMAGSEVHWGTRGISNFCPEGKMCTLGAFASLHTPNATLFGMTGSTPLMRPLSSQVPTRTRSTRVRPAGIANATPSNSRRAV